MTGVVRGLRHGWLSWILAAGTVGAAEFALAPYVDPSQLDVAWPRHSHYRQPWRAYLETRSGEEFRRGLGINFNVPDESVDLGARLLAEAGFTAVRIEIGWGSVNWEETALNGAERIQRRFEACRRHGLRPTVLLNAHHGVPCPVRFLERRVAAAAAAGERAVTLDSTAEIVPRYTGLSNLTDYMAAQVFITEVGAEPPGTCRLARPLPKALAAGEKVLLATLKVLPAHPVGTPEFEALAQGWERYAGLVVASVRAAGIEDFDIEIWNELSFGSAFLGTHGINHYYDPPLVRFGADFLHPGGHAWEVGRRTVERVRRTAPQARCIWGFSNTTFFHTPVEELPPGVAGQSYHPYGTGTRELPKQEQAPDDPGRCLEGYVPTQALRLPEGWAQTFLQTESLMRLLNPEARRRHPAGTERFRHYMTEHGVAPPECGVEDEAGCWDLKARCALRAFCFWLGKGVDVMHYYCAYDEKPAGMGLLPATLRQLPADARFEAVATPPLRAVQRLARAFADAKPVAEPTPLGVQAVALAEGRPAFAGDATHPPLWERDLLVVLPFQLQPRRFVVVVYGMSGDVTRPPPDLAYRITFTGLPAGVTAARVHDPLLDRDIPATVTPGEGGRLTVELPVSDSPRLVTLSAG